MKITVNCWILWIFISANTRRWPMVSSMLVHRLRRWPNIEPTMTLTISTLCLLLYFKCANFQIVCVDVGVIWDASHWASSYNLGWSKMKVNYSLITQSILKRFPRHLVTVFCKKRWQFLKIRVFQKLHNLTCSAILRINRNEGLEYLLHVKWSSFWNYTIFFYKISRIFCKWLENCVYKFYNNRLWIITEKLDVILD